MRRSPGPLRHAPLDVLVVGGGITGACIARDAALRGLRVGLIERGDFGVGASSQSLRVVHGGIRYLQHGDLPRVRASIRERRAWLRIAPHLVQPQAFYLPAYGRGRDGRLLLGAGLLFYDLLSADRNRGVEDPSRRIPRGRLASRGEMLRAFPGLDRRRLTGGAVFHDGQIFNAPRLVLACLRSAAERGAVLANYVRAGPVLRRGARVVGVEARDLLGDRTLEIRADVVVNAAGGWAPAWLRRNGMALRPAPRFSRDACLAISRPMSGPGALGVTIRSRDRDALLSRSGRHLFLVPWRGRTLVGVWHRVEGGAPGARDLTPGEVEAFVEEVDAAYPAAGFGVEDVEWAHAGPVLFREEAAGGSELSFGSRSLVVDHEEADGVRGLVTAIAVRFTVGRSLAERVGALLCRKLAVPPGRAGTDRRPVHGGGIPRMAEHERRAVRERPPGLSRAGARALARNHGSGYPAVLEIAEREPELAGTVDGTEVLRAEVAHAVRTEAAVRLSDVVRRRTDLALGGIPRPPVLEETAELMARELGWSPGRTRQEVDALVPVHRRRTAVGGGP